MITNSLEKKKTVTAPQQTFLLNTNTVNVPSTVISVELKENEDVEWIWTVYSNGQRVVTGYDIIQK